MNEYLNWLTNLISQLGNWGYFLIALISFLEAIPLLSFFIPGVVIFIFGGWLVAEGVFDFFNLVVICACFMFLGDMVAFVIGRRWINSKDKDYSIIKKSYLESAEKFMAKHGRLGVFWGRFFGPVRSMLYVLVGFLKTPWLKFIWPAAFSSLIFSALYIGIGYIIGSAWQTFESWSGRLAVVISSVIFILLFFWWLKGFVVKQGKQLKTILASALNAFFGWYQTTKRWQLFSKKFFRLSKAIIKLSNPKNFFGLPLVGLIVSNLFLTILVIYFGVLVKGQNNYLLNLDYRIESFVKLFTQPHLAVLMFFVTMLMSSYFILASSILVSLWLLWERRRSYIIGLWTIIGGVFLTTSLIKLFIARPRPLPTFLFEDSYAFPSWHAAISLALLFYLVYTTVRYYPRWSRNVSLFFISSLFVIAIGFSRLYLGIHYFSDVIAGYFVGLWWLVVAIICQRYFALFDNPKKINKIFKWVVLSGMIIFTLLIYSFQVFKNRGVSASFFSGLARLSNRERILLNTSEFDKDLLVTENLRGVGRRPINFIINDQSTSLEKVLTDAGWTKRLTPTLGNVINRGKFFVFKNDYPDAPLQPRFWDNEPNDLTFTKKLDSDQLSDFYILRLWQIGDSWPYKFIAEVSINKDVSWSSLFKKGLLESVIDLVLKDFSQSNQLVGFEARNINLILDNDEPKGVNSLIYIVNLK